MAQLTALFNIHNQYDIIILLFTLVILTIFLKSLYVFKQNCFKNKLNWSDLVRAKGTNNVSLTKLMQLVGFITATGIIIALTIQQKISWDMFALYLSYTGGSEAYSKYLSAKHGAVETIHKTIEKVEEKFDDKK